jgi:hypothetical protein
VTGSKALDGSTNSAKSVSNRLLPCDLYTPSLQALTDRVGLGRVNFFSNKKVFRTRGKQKTNEGQEKKHWPQRLVCKSAKWASKSLVAFGFRRRRERGGVLVESVKDRSPNNEVGIIDRTGSSESDVSSRDIEKN